LLTYVHIELALGDDSREIVFLDDTPTPTKVVLHFRRTKWEMLPVGIETRTSFQIDKIVDTRSRRGNTEDFVQWKGWDQFYNSWLPRAYIQNYGHPRNHFYVTLFSNASKEVFPDNTLTAYTILLSQPIDLG